MRKLNAFFSLMLLLVLTSNAFGQQNRSIFTIGSTLSTSNNPNQQSTTCYPYTPVPIRSNALDNNTNLTGNTSSSFLVTTNNQNYTEIFTSAYARGFRHFLFQEGLYIIDTPINLDGLNGITIEGGGAGTVFKPSSVDLVAIFDVKNCYNGKIKNLAIDLKTTLTCVTGGQDQNDANTGIKIGNQVGRCLFEDIYFRSNIAPNATIKATSPILVELTAGQESDWNTFNNIQFQRSLGGVVLNINDGVFSHNKFSNIHFELAVVGIDFTGSGGTIEGNIFSDIEFQASSSNGTGADLKKRSTDVVRNIRGVNNIFTNFQIADLNPCVTAGGECTAVGYVFSLTAQATRTTIANCEVDGITNNNISGEKAGWYKDLGAGTHFIGNASTNRLTDYILKDVNDLYYEGYIAPGKAQADAQNDSKFNFLAYKNFNRVIFKNDPFAVNSGNTTKMFTNSAFYIQDYKNIYIGNRTPTGAFLEEPSSNFYIYGNMSLSTHNNMFLDGATTGNGMPPVSTDTNAKKFVITNANGGGKFQWSNISDLTWNHIATKNIKMNGFALTNHSNASPANSDPGIRLDDLGNVRIGTTAPFANNPAKLQVDGRVFVGTANDGMNGYDPDYKLLVNGKVLVRNEVYVKNVNIGWADYVFSKDYKLLPLSEVEKHINEKGYLPNMPSAAEVEKDGIAVGDIIKRQQEKIEELTLYLIEQNKKIEEQNKKIEALIQNLKKN